MHISNVSFVLDPSSILVEPGGNPEQNGDMLAVGPNGLLQVETLRQGTDFSFYRCFDGQTGNVRISDTLRVKRGDKLVTSVGCGSPGCALEKKR